MVGGAVELKQFTWAKDDDFAAEHAAVWRYVEDAVALVGAENWPEKVELSSLPSGKSLLDADATSQCRLTIAALLQVRFWEAQIAQVEEAHPSIRDHQELPGWGEIFSRNLKALAVVETLIERELPLSEAQLIELVDWCISLESVAAWSAPVEGITRAVQCYAASKEIGPELMRSLRQFAKRLLGAIDIQANDCGTAIELLIPDDEPSENRDSSRVERQPVQPAPAGNPQVLVRLKQYLHLHRTEAPALEEKNRSSADPQLPLASDRALLDELQSNVSHQPGWRYRELNKTETAKKIFAMEDSARGRLLLAACEHDIEYLLNPPAVMNHQTWGWQRDARELVCWIANTKFALSRDGAFDFLLYLATRGGLLLRVEYPDELAQILDQIGGLIKESPLTAGERYVLHLLRISQIEQPPLGTVSRDIRRLTKLIGDALNFFLVPGEAWTDQMNSDISAMLEDRQAAWTALLKHMLTATSARPTKKWLRTASQLAEKIGSSSVIDALRDWFALVPKGRSQKQTPVRPHDHYSTADTMIEKNGIALRGLLWLIPTLETAAGLLREITAVAFSAYRKVPGIGPRAIKVGHAAVYALSAIATQEALGQLALIKTRVKFGGAQQQIARAFNAVAEALGLPADQIEELSVPSYGLSEVGTRRETFDGVTAELRVDGRDVHLHWLRSDGKPQKSIPATVKTNHSDELKELKTAAKDISAMLPAQCERIDQTFLLQKQWEFSKWRERYLDHPLVGTIARRLIWVLKDKSEAKAGIWHAGQLVDVNDNPLQLPSDAAVELWHPIGRPAQDIVAWRDWLERHEVRQPFKQAYREIYLLTDAERRTATYSNRFAGHILRQHQFNALCAARGWRNKLRMMVDDTYPPAMRLLPQWGLRAEYWVEGAGEEMTDSGAYLRVATDQVRFYRIGAAPNFSHSGGGQYTSEAAGPGDANVNEPLPLDQIPALVLSEVLRDVDLFVGVASVGNDPNWQDGGPDGRYATYWQNYSFGELTETAQTRRAVLERLLPRLTKIRDRCSLEDRFLVVRGDLRTYKIHLGSGNILMKPNDQYLCIVPSRSTTAGPSDVFLPFEGDGVLSIILSKAFLLAADRNIKDETITRQIRQMS